MAFSVCPLHLHVWWHNSPHFVFKLQALCCETVNLNKMHDYHPEAFLQSTGSQLRSLLHDAKKVLCSLLHGVLLAIQGPPHLTQQYKSQLLLGYHPPFPWTSQTNIKMNLANFQLDAQNSFSFIYNTFIKIPYMFRAVRCSSSGGLIVSMQPLISSLCKQVSCLQLL